MPSVGLLALLLAAQPGGSEPEFRDVELAPGRYVERAEDGSPACGSQEALSFLWAPGGDDGDPEITLEFDDTARRFTMTRLRGPSIPQGEEAGFMTGTGEGDADSRLMLVSKAFESGDVQIQAAYLYDPDISLVTRAGTTHGTLADGRTLRHFTHCG